MFKKTARTMYNSLHPAFESAKSSTDPENHVGHCLWFRVSGLGLRRFRGFKV